MGGHAWLAVTHDGKTMHYGLWPDAQATHFNALMKSDVAWRYTNTCASWASEVVQEVVGEDVDADDWAGFETPRELGQNILKLEAKQPTTLGSPKPLKNNPTSSLIKRKG